MAAKPCTPAYFGVFLARSWGGNDQGAPPVLRDTPPWLHGFIALWRINGPPQDRDDGLSTDQEEAPAPLPMYLMDPITGRRISPLMAAALCVKPRRQMTTRQIVNLDASKAASAEFTTMRHLAVRFRGLLRGGTVEKLDVWLRDARRSGIYGMRRFARALRHDIEAVRNAVLEPWSNAQTEGQINRLKTLTRAMYRGAGVDLLRARLIPLRSPNRSWRFSEQ
jgi:hypothetical protein